jgi:hypothetical protein
MYLRAWAEERLKMGAEACETYGPTLAATVAWGNYSEV